MKHSLWIFESVQYAVKATIAAAGLLAIAAAPSIALADGFAGGDSQSTNGVYVTILSPNPGTSLTGVKQIEISAYYESSFGVASLDLVIDGKKLATQKLSSPENRGEISFLVDASSLRSGSHSIVVRATATDAEVSSARAAFVLPGSSENQGDFKRPEQQSPSSDNALSNAVGVPTINVLSPAADSTVAGIVRIKVDAIDPSGKSPYVSLFVDHAFKTLRNFPPYTFDWDTTRLTNGLHTIEVWGYNDAQQVGHADPVKVMVNNPSGRTFERHDLLDAAPVTGKLKPAAQIAWRATVKTAKIAASPARTILSTKSALTTTSTKLAADPALVSEDSRVALLVAKGDRMASIAANMDQLGAASVDETLIAPVFNEAPAVSAPASKAAPTVQNATRGSAVAQGQPETISAAITASRSAAYGAQFQRLSSSDLSDLDSDSIQTDPIVPGAVVQSSKSVPSAAKVNHGRLAGQPIFATGKSADTALAPVARSKYIRMASTAVDQDIVTGQDQLTAPNLAFIASAAAKSVHAISQHTVTLSNFSRKDRGNLDGAYEVVVDDQRVNMDRPLQAKGALLFAPFRQIFESQGGILTWDNNRQQVHAVSSTREITITIGIKSALVNNENVGLSAAPYLDMDRTMLPLDFFHVALGARVSYDAVSGHLVIESR